MDQKIDDNAMHRAIIQKFQAMRVLTGLILVSLLMVASVTTAQIQSHTPTRNATGVAADATIIVNYENTAVVDDVLDNGTFLVKGNYTGYYTGTLSNYVIFGVAFTPDEPFKPGETITVTVATTTGTTLEEAYTFQFTVASNEVDANFDVINVVDVTTANGPRFVYPVDLDSDGDVDILCASNDDDKISWFENDGAGNFTTPANTKINTTDIDGAASVWADDINGDGYMDVLSASKFDGRVMWFQNDGSQNFTEQTIFDAGTYNNTFMVCAADLDGDGDPDAASIVLSDNKLSWHQNDGAGNFTTHDIDTDLGGPYCVWPADLDDDGDMDLITASANSSQIDWFVNDGDGNFTKQTVSTAVGSVVRVRTADMDGDGDLDLLSNAYSSNTLYWLENDGSNNFDDTHLVSDTQYGGYEVRGVDIDGDGDMDILTTTTQYGYDAVNWFENDGSQNFTSHTVTTDLDLPYGADAADLDGDGDIDILSGSANDDKIAWYPNNLAPIIGGTEGDQFMSDEFTMAPFAEVTITDQDADQSITLTITLDDDAKGVFTAASLSAAGITDAGNGVYTFSGLPEDAQTAIRQLVFEPTAGRLDAGETETLSITLTADDGVSAASTDNITTITIMGAIHVVSTSPQAYTITAATDATITITLDAAVTTVDDTNLLVRGEQTGFYAGTASGSGATTITFTADESFKPGELITVTLTQYLVGTPYTLQFTVASAAVTANFVATDPITTNTNGPYDVYPTDLDGDGDLDVLTASGDDDKVAWFTNDGAQTFTEADITMAADYVRSVYSADLDGDGDLDVLSASALGDTFSWYENDGSESFTQHDIKTDADGAIAIQAADLDGDGDLDAVGVAADDGMVCWFENDGDGNFTEHTVASGISNVWMIRTGDMDADGDMDLVVATNTSNSILWFENDGAANFTQQTVTSSINRAYALQVADIDSDGDLDVVGAAYTGDKIVWYENDGAAAFTAHDLTTGSDGACAVFVADVDGDGDQDILASYYLDKTVVWLENDGAATFTEHEIATSLGSPYSLYASDVDVDGDIDLLFVEQSTDQVSFYVNNLPPVISGTVASQSVDDNETVQPFSAVSITDRDAGQVLTVTISLDDDEKGAFTAASLTAAGVTDAGNGSYTISGTAAVVQAAVQQLVFEPTADRLTTDSETVTFTISANDGISAATTDNVTTVIVFNVNDAPSFTAGNNVTVLENSGAYSATWATDVSAGPDNESSQTLSFTVTNDNNDLFSAQPAIAADGTLTFTPAADVFGEAVVTVVLSDDGGTGNQTDAVTFTITITNVNNVPSFTAGNDVDVNEDVGAYSATWATDLSAGAGEDSQTLSFSVTNDDNDLFSAQPAIAADGTLTFTAAADAYGEATVIVVLQDDGGTDNGGVDESNAVTFTITVNNVNDVPLIDAVSNVTVDMNSDAFTIALTGISAGPNEDDQTLTASIAADNTTLLSAPTVTLAGDGTGTVTLAPTDNLSGTATLTITLQDDGGTDNGGIDQTTVTFTLTVEETITEAVFIPNLFSPNGDGANDVFRVRASGVADIKFIVYSTSGERVFATSNVTTATETGWDGRYQGRDMPAGTYTWTLQGHYTDGASLTSGSSQYGQVMLLR